MIFALVYLQLHEILRFLMTNRGRLYNFFVKAMPEWWWAEARSDYNHLATLTRQLDSRISIMVLLSFATDLYFICIQLLFSFKYTRQNFILFVHVVPHPLSSHYDFSFELTREWLASPTFGRHFWKQLILHCIVIVIVRDQGKTVNVMFFYVCWAIFFGAPFLHAWVR